MFVELTEADGLVLDLRYAGANNIAGRPIYRRAVALLHAVAREKLLATAARAGAMGLRLKIFDAFRPLEAQQAFWALLPDPRFVADPSQGGIHPRGVAVDLTLVAASDGAELDMGTGFDAMTPASAHASLDVSAEALRNRALLLGLMTATGWSSTPHEWWHYNLPNFTEFPSMRAADVPNGPM